MSETRSIFEVLVPLISQDRVPLVTIAVIGEIIAVDAKLLDYEPVAKNRASHEEFGIFLETYEKLLKRTQSAVAEFSQTHNRQVLTLILSEIKEKLKAL